MDDLFPIDQKKVEPVKGALLDNTELNANTRSVGINFFRLRLLLETQLKKYGELKFEDTDLLSNKGTDILCHYILFRNIYDEYEMLDPLMDIYLDSNSRFCVSTENSFLGVRSYKQLCFLLDALKDRKYTVTLEPIKKRNEGEEISVLFKVSKENIETLTELITCVSEISKTMDQFSKLLDGTENDLPF